MKQRPGCTEYKKVFLSKLIPARLPCISNAYKLLTNAEKPKTPVGIVWDEGHMS